MSKIWKITTAAAAQPHPTCGNDLADLMASLDALPTEKPKAKPRAPKLEQISENLEPVYVQQWFPRSIVMHFTTQVCQCCGNVYENVTGLFLEDQHRNGALRQVRCEMTAIPAEYRSLPKRQQSADETITYCIVCFDEEIKAPEPELPADLIRELTKEDRDSLIQQVEESPLLQEQLHEYLEQLNEDIAGGAITEAEADKLYDIRLREIKREARHG